MLITLLILLYRQRVLLAHLDKQALLEVLAVLLVVPQDNMIIQALAQIAQLVAQPVLLMVLHIVQHVIIITHILQLLTHAQLV